MKKVTIIMGRGIEGCGVTKFTLEQNDWFNRNGVQSSVYSAKDKSWTRKNSHDCASVNNVKFADDAEANKIIEACNSSDAVIITSLPSLSHPEKCIAYFKRIIASINKPIVLIQLDHRSASIKRNAALDESIKASTVMFSLSRQNDFSEYARSLLGNTGIASFFDEDVSEEKEIFAYQVGYQFEVNKRKFWKDIGEQDPKHHKWIGRTTSWKGYQQMFKFHNEFLMNNDCLTTFEGIEKSPAYLGFKDLSEYVECIDKDANDYDFSQSYGKRVHVFGPYANEALLHRLSRCGFGYQLSLLDQKYIENALEYTHCEIVSAGCVPVFRAGWGQRAKHRVTNVPLIECENTGTVWLDDNDMQPAFELIKRLESDPVMRDEYRNMAYEFYHTHQDAEYIYTDMFKKMKDSLKLN